MQNEFLRTRTYIIINVIKRYVHLTERKKINRTKKSKCN